MLRQNRIQIIKYAPPPSDLPVYGKGDQKEISFIGRTNYVASLEEKRFVFGIKRHDRKRHIYIVGKSGVGKSKLLECMVRQDIAYGHGVCLFDPNGDSIQSLLDFIPKERIQDVVVIDPTDRDFPVYFNPLAKVDPGFRHQLVEGIIEIMEAQFGSNWIPRMEHIFRFTLLSLLEYPNVTLYDAIRVITDQEFRREVMKTCSDGMVKHFFEVEFGEWLRNEGVENEAITPLVNKLGQFLSNPLLRNILSQKENRIDFEYLMRERKIVLINLARNVLGRENASFFGSLFIIKLKEAGMAMMHDPEENRDDFYLYVDDFHHLITETFENIMFDGKKYGISATVAHQYLGQIVEHFRSSIFGNVGAIIIFRVAGEDAAVLAPEMVPVFEAKDMINLAMQEFYVKMTIDGDTYDPFSAETLKVFPPTHASYRDDVIAESRKRYAWRKREESDLGPPRPEPEMLL